VRWKDKGSGGAVVRTKQVGEGSPNVMDLIRAGKVDLIINTPGAGQGRRDGYEIRRAAVDFCVPYITTIQAAVAAGDAVAVAAGKDGIKHCWHLVCGSVIIYEYLY